MSASNWIDAARSRLGSDPQALRYHVAERLYRAHNENRGALYPGGFGFLRGNDQDVWFRKADRLLGRDS